MTKKGKGVKLHSFLDKWCKTASYQPEFSILGEVMVLISDGNSEIGSHVWSNHCYLLCLRHSIQIFFLRKYVFFLHACATCSELPSNISTVGEEELFRGIWFGFQIRFVAKISCSGGDILILEIIKKNSMNYPVGFHLNKEFFSA